MVKRGEIYWATIDGAAGRRPVVIATRDDALSVLTTITAAPITRTIRGIRSEVPVGKREGLPARSVVSCDNLRNIAKERLDVEPIGYLGRDKMRLLDQALRFALGIRY